MSCPNATAPIDISLSKITGNCDYKCAYSFYYNNSSCIAENKGNYLNIKYDKSSSPPVTYNAAGYDVTGIRIYSPSLHSYSGFKTDAEMVIIHSSNTGANPLLVCVPIKSNNSNGAIATFFSTLIDTVANSAPAEGNTTTVNVPRFNLNEFVPHKPFFSYSASLPYQPCDSRVEYVVFDLAHTNLYITPDSLKKFNEIIQPSPYDIKTGPNLFYNEKGPGSGGALGNEIYIDCQPVGSSQEMEDIVTETGGSVTSVSDLLNNQYVQMVLASLIFIALLYGVKTLMGFFQPTKGGAIGTTTSSALDVSKYIK